MINQDTSSDSGPSLEHHFGENFAQNPVRPSPKRRKTCPGMARGSLRGRRLRRVLRLRGRAML